MNRVRNLRGVTILAIAAVLYSPCAFGQVLPKNKASGGKGAPGPVAAQPAVRTSGETPGQTRREGREEARDTRAEAKQAGETRPEARQTARETRQETRQNIQATRGADLGVWFNNRAAAGANSGLVISEVTNNSVLGTAGLRSGDQIMSINGQPVTSEAQFVQFLTGPNLGTQPVQIIVMRNGQQQTLTVQPTALAQGVVDYDPLYQYGIVIDDSNANQILVQRVYPRTPAYYAGLRAGDVISTFNGQAITNLKGFTQMLTRANGSLALGVTRAGQTQNLQLDAAGTGDSSVRTALRPNFDGNAGTSAGAGTNAGAGTSGSINAQGGANINAPGVNVNTPGVNASAGLNAGTSTGAAAQGQLRTEAGASGSSPQTPTTPAAPAAAPGQPRTGIAPTTGGQPGTAAPTTGSAGVGGTVGGAAGAGTTSGSGTNVGAGAGTGAGAGAGAGAATGGTGTSAGAGGTGGAGAGASGT